MIDFIQQILEQLQATQPIEIIAMLTGIWSVWLAARNHVAVYPVGIISTTLYIYICFAAHIYALGGLQIYFTLMSFWGWYNWTKKNHDQDAYPISWCTPRDYWTALLVVTIVGVIVYIIHQSTHGEMPWWDGSSAALQVVGMWWMTRRKIENWIAWSLANCIALPVFWNTGLYFTCLQYIVFLLIAIRGYIEWRRLYRIENPVENPNN